MDSPTGDSFACFLDCFDTQGLQSLYIDDVVDSAVSGGGHHHGDYSSAPPDAGGSNCRSSSAAAAAAAAAASRGGSSRNVVTERRSRRRLNDTLYALRSVVPNITKMDRASVVKDSIEYILQLLAEIYLLESAAASTHPLLICSDGHAVSPTKKMKTALSSGSPASHGSHAPPLVDAQEVKVSGAGDKVLVVSVACRRWRDAVAKLCRALDGLRLPVIAVNITSTSGTVTHTAVVQRQELHQSEMKDLVQTAVAHLDGVSLEVHSAP